VSRASTPISPCRQNACAVNPDVKVLTVSATTGTGLETWYGWLASVDAGVYPARPAGD